MSAWLEASTLPVRLSPTLIRGRLIVSAAVPATPATTRSSPSRSRKPALSTSSRRADSSAIDVSRLSGETSAPIFLLISSSEESDALRSRSPANTRALSRATAAWPASAVMTESSAADGVCGSHQYAASAPSTSPLLTSGTESTERYPSRSISIRISALIGTAGSFSTSTLHTGSRRSTARPVVPSPRGTRIDFMNSGDSPRPRS